MKEIEELAKVLIKDKLVCFSFETNEGQNSVKIRECEEYDFEEYGEEYKEGEMFEIGPTKPTNSIITTKLNFKDMQEAGNAVLKLRAELLGQSWGSA